MQRQKRIGVREVARAAGVSVATVSRVVANTGYPVAEATRTKVMEAVQALGFVPNLLAQTFATSRTNTLGVALPLLNPYYAKMLAGIEREAVEHGLSLQLTLVGGDADNREKAIDGFLGRQLDGIIVCSGWDDLPLRRAPKDVGVPLVIVGNEPTEGFPTVTIDNHRASFEATTHLLERGHSDILMLTSNAHWPDFRERLRGFRDRLEGHGNSANGHVIEGVFDEQDAYDTVRKLWIEKTKITAILAATDRQALGALAALLDLGVSVPQDMALVGFDDLHASQFVRPALSSVDMPAGEMGAIAVRMLAGTSQSGSDAPTDRTLDPRLIVRQSS